MLIAEPRQTSIYLLKFEIVERDLNRSINSTSILNLNKISYKIRFSPQARGWDDLFSVNGPPRRDSFSRPALYVRNGHLGLSSPEWTGTCPAFESSFHL